MRLFLFAIMLLMVVAVSIASLAQEVPAENDNECYTGGLLEGECTSDWHWECGWYIRNHRSAGTAIPEWCGYEQLPAYPSTYCADTRSGRVQFNGGWWLAAPVDLYFEGCFSRVMAQSGYNIIYAPAPYNPHELCKEAFGPNVNAYIFYDPDIYFCAN